ncbi:hypothetical protein B566_EDAN001045 [Ephemera danica]|nr:hypothetical protein B566_EDAN001045 [Ephemera danica]
MASAGEKGCKKLCTICNKMGIKRLTTDNILYYYAPLQGAVSFTALSVNSMNPAFMMRLLPKKDVTGMLLVSSMVGTGLYIYGRPHLQAAPTQAKFSYSMKLIEIRRNKLNFFNENTIAYGSLVFNFGSLLLFAVAKSYLPENSSVATLVGLASCYSLIKVGTSYLEYVDSNCKK